MSNRGHATVLTGETDSKTREGALPLLPAPLATIFCDVRLSTSATWKLVHSQACCPDAVAPNLARYRGDGGESGANEGDGRGGRGFDRT